MKDRKHEKKMSWCLKQAKMCLDDSLKEKQLHPHHYNDDDALDEEDSEIEQTAFFVILRVNQVSITCEVTQSQILQKQESFT